MGTIHASAIFAKAARLLGDETNVRWTEAELIDWLNSGQREVVLKKPNSLAVNGVLALVAGTKQTLPATALQLIDVIRNMGADGATPGRAVTSVPRGVMDVASPDWHMTTANTSVKHYIYDIKDPKTFYVFPPQPTGTAQKLEIVYPIAPTDLTADTQSITLDDIYEGCLIDYILYRSYSKDADFAGNDTKALAYYQAFLNALGVKLAAETSFAPKEDQNKG